MSITIWAPHPDDEIIGCHSVLRTQNDVGVFFQTGCDSDGARRSQSEFNFAMLADFVRGYWDVVYAPDPDVDLHPLHQEMGNRARVLFRCGRISRLIHYTTTMQAKYIFEVDAEKKRGVLDRCYPEKSNLWKFDHRYFLFEGYCEWHRPV